MSEVMASGADPRPHQAAEPAGGAGASVAPLLELDTVEFIDLDKARISPAVLDV